MPPKKRARGMHSGVKVGVSFGRKPNCREAAVQTDEELAALMGAVSALNSAESATGDRAKSDSAILLRRQNILMMQLRKVGRQNLEMREIISKYEQIPNLLQATKVHYLYVFNSIRDDISMLVLEQQNRETKLMNLLRNQKFSVERQIAVKDDKLKAKEEKNKTLKAEKKLLIANMELLQEAMELEQRRVQVAVKEQCNALDEAQEIRQKMEDKLFLAANQRCGTCQTRESVQDDLTNQIAEKLGQIEELRRQLQMKDDAIVEKDRINQILIGKLEKIRGELKDKSFAVTSYQSELTKQQRTLKQAQVEIQQLRATTSSSNNTIVHEHQQLNPHILTPPEEDTDKEQTLQFVKKKPPKANGSPTGGEGTNSRGKEKMVTERFFLPPPLKRNDSNNILPTPPQQQNLTMARTTALESIGHQQQTTKTHHQQQGAIVQKSWRPTGEPPTTQKPQQPFVPTQMHHQQQQQHLQQPCQQQHFHNSLPAVGATTSTKPTTTSSLNQPFFFPNNNIIYSNNSLPFRKCVGATIDDFYGGSKTTTYNNNNNGRGIRTPLPIDTGGAGILSGTWRKNVPDKFSINRPADNPPDVFNTQQLRDRIEQEIRVAIASPFVVATNSAAVHVAALPPMYACQQQTFPQPRPSAPIQRPSVRMPAQRLNFNNSNNLCIPRMSKQHVCGTLPWHAQSSGTFPYSANQFFTR